MVSKNEIKHAARVLSRYRDARRTRILRIRLRLTVRVNKKYKNTIRYRHTSDTGMTQIMA